MHRFEMSCDASASRPQPGLEFRHRSRMLALFVERRAEEEVDPDPTPNGTFQGGPDTILSIPGFRVVLRGDEGREHEDIAARCIHNFLEPVEVIAPAKQDLIRRHIRLDR
jgi:hypothetical protein